jgi:hypothetical protein
MILRYEIILFRVVDWSRYKKIRIKGKIYFDVLKLSLDINEGCVGF